MMIPLFLPYWVFLTYIYALIVSKVILIASRIPKEGYSFFKMSSWVALISLSAFILECIFMHVFAVLMRFNDIRLYPQSVLGYSIYANTVFFTFTLISVCFCAYFCYLLNMRFSLQHITTTGGNRERAIFIISMLTAPFVFLVPISEMIKSSIKW